MPSFNLVLCRPAGCEFAQALSACRASLRGRKHPLQGATFKGMHRSHESRDVGTGWVGCRIARACAVLLSLWLAACGASTSTPAANPGPDTSISNGTELYRRGEEAASQGDTVRAEQYLTMALDRGFDDSKVLPILLRVCLSSNRLRAALNHAERYLRDHPNDQSLRYLVATLHLSLGQIEQTRIDLNHLLRVNPRNASAHYLLGVLESVGVTPDRANEYFRTYLELSPNGEHAAEVKSRLTDLSVRTELESVTSAHDVTISLSQQPSAPDPSSQGSSAWFRGMSDTAPTSEGEGESR